MTPTTIIKRAAQTTLLCTGLVTASAVWSCPEDAGAANATNRHSAQAQTSPTGTAAQGAKLSAAQMYTLFHNPALNKSDGLASDAEDFRAKYPN